MAYDIIANATWTYSNGTLTHVPTGTSKVIDIAANPALHLILSAQHWKNLGSKTVYSDNPADWVERKIKWARASETPPVLEIEQTIGAGDYAEYTVYFLEDAPEFSELIQTLTNGFNILRSRPVTKPDTRAFLKVMVRLFQKAGLITDDLGD